ncbi:unnamed protein product [Urochloa decumbens]|uniref:F-box/LRR-repeat protein 15/At3g58940/PEG3-like LRR domain-containing protein n=1 Tax=Urochloa decumbens TaxID=240449 RepID=A0ABC9H1I9_9POAL
MEQERTPPASKRARMPSPSQSQAQAQAVDDAEDRLSALDDGALHAILARLPLRDAAATAVLSRRWPRVFATLPRLRLHPATFNRRGYDGDEDDCEDAHRWMDALGRVLDGRAAPVAAFEVRAKFMGLYDGWFHDAFRRLCGSGGLLELGVVNTKYDECYPLPSPVYCCATLTSLDLYNWRIRVPGRLAAAGLRAVRSLRLRDVVATDADLRRLISRCGALEHLEIHDVHRARNVVVRAPCLEKLEVFSFRPLRVSVKKAPRLGTVRLDLSYCYPEDSWSINDTMDSEEDYSFSEIEAMCDYEKMAEREHKQTDEVRNMVTFLRGLCGVKKLQLYLPTEYSEVLSKVRVSMLKRLPKKNYLLGLETLALTLDHNDKVLATFVSCLLNSSPNLKNLIIKEVWGMGSSVPLPAEFWEEQVDADCTLNHLSSVTFYIESLFKGNPCGSLCRFLVMNARVLRRLCIEYYRSKVRPEDAAKVEEVWKELHCWPRASPDAVLELCPLDRCPSY